MTPIAKSFSRWALPLSVSLNVFLIAVAGVHEWHQAGHGPGGPPGPERMIEHLARHLPPADAEALRQAFAAEPALLRDDHRFMDEDMAKVREAMRAEPFDPAALAAALDHGHQIRDAHDQAIGRALVKAATAMSPAGRRQLADHGPGGPHGPPPGPPR